MSILAGHWQQSANWGQGDFNGDGFVDVTDLSMSMLAGAWQANIGQQMSFGAALAMVGLGGVSVPEAGTLGMLRMGVVMLVSRRRRC